jgi:ferredoxin
MEGGPPRSGSEGTAGRVVEETAVAEGRWRVTVDPDLCIGSGMCAGTAPHAFELVDGVSRPLAEEIDPDDVVLGAAESCPVEAIMIRDLNTGEVLAPEQ